jgi:hypothetical protein
MFNSLILEDLTNSSSKAALKDIINNTSMEWAKIYKILIDYLPENYDATIPVDIIGEYILDADSDFDVSDFDEWLEESRPLNGRFDAVYTKNSLSMNEVIRLLTSYYYEIEAFDEEYACEIHAKDVARGIFKEYFENA